MRTMGYGYGGEWHMLRFLGYHRSELDEVVCEATGAESVVWLDRRFDASQRLGDAAWHSLEFLGEDHPARTSWPDFWPARGPRWAAVARLRSNGQEIWLLVDAVAHLRELVTELGTSAEGVREGVEQAFTVTRRGLGIPEAGDWMRPYYRFATRLAALHHLRRAGVDAHLLYIYFVGDEHPADIPPKEDNHWSSVVHQQDRHLGLTRVSRRGIYRMFIDTFKGGSRMPLS